MPFPVPAPGALCTGSPGAGRDELEGKGPQKGAQQRLDRRLEEVAKAVGAGYCRLQMPLRLALAVRGTVAGHRLGALEGGGGGLYLTPLAMHAWGPGVRIPCCMCAPGLTPTPLLCPTNRPELRAERGNSDSRPGPRDVPCRVPRPNGPPLGRKMGRYGDQKRAHHGSGFPKVIDDPFACPDKYCSPVCLWSPGLHPPYGDMWCLGHREQAHVSTTTASSVVPWPPFGSAVTSGRLNWAYREHCVKPTPCLLPARHRRCRHYD